MWTIFSYLTAIAAGILAFGSERIEPDALICIAASPLLFWFWTTYLPLDRYGNLTVNRLAAIERHLNDVFQTQLKHFAGPAHELSIVCGILKAVKTGTPRARMCALWGQVHRARFAICFLFLLLHLGFIYEAKIFWKLHKSGQALFLTKPAPAPAVGRPR